MSSDLSEFRERLLALDHPDKILRLADDFLTMLERQGEAFVLPRQYALIRPVLEYYAGDLPGWLKFVRGVRDRLPLKSDERAAVQAFYRTLDVRHVQKIRRDRIKLAVDNATKAGKLTSDANDRHRYARRVVQHWSKRRFAAMDEAREKGARDRLTAEERNEICDLFWESVDEELSIGGFPPL